MSVNETKTDKVDSMKLAFFKKQEHHDYVDMYSQTILVDMDGTIANYDEAMSSAMREYYKRNDITTENWHSLSLPDIHNVRCMLQSVPGFFYNLKPIQGALEALCEMEEKGYNVYILSSPSIKSDSCHSEKCMWLRDKMGDKWARRLILTKDKTMVYGDYLIDDKPHISGLIDNPCWRHIVYAHHYNVNIPENEHKKYLHDWNDWLSVIN